MANDEVIVSCNNCLFLCNNLNLCRNQQRSPTDLLLAVQTAERMCVSQSALNFVFRILDFVNAQLYESLRIHTSLIRLHLLPSLPH